MKARDVMRLLNDLEAQLPVAEWTLRGVPVWPVFRIYLGSTVDDFTAPSPSAGPARSRVKPWVDLAGRLARDWRAARVDRAHEAPELGPVDVVFLNHTTCRVFQLRGAWYDLFCEPIAELLDAKGSTSLLLELAPQSEYRLPRSRASRLIQAQVTGIQLAARAWAKLERDFPGAAHLAAYLETHRPELRLDFSEVARRLHAIRLLADYFARHLKKLAPKLAFVVNYYDVPGLAFNLACRELGICSVDIQHGVQGELHAAYAGWQKVPAAGYGVLPNLFWCWSDREAEVIRSWSAGVERWHRPLVAGNLGLAQFLNSDGGVPKLFDEDVSEHKRAGEENILVSLQTGRALPELIHEVIAAAPRDWCWWIRLHPAMMAERPLVKQRLSSLAGARIVFDAATSLPLYALLRHMDAHVTEASSVVLEAERFGVPSVLCHPLGTDTYAGYLQPGSAVSAYDRDSVLRAIGEQLTQKAERSRARDYRAINADELSRLVEAPWEAT